MRRSRWARTASASARRRWTSASCAAGRTRWCSRLTDGLAEAGKQRKVEVVRGVGRFVGPNEIEVSRRGREPVHKLRAMHHRRGFRAGEAAVHARGSAHHGFDRGAGTGRPAGRMLVIGGGIIGLEMASVYEALGAQVSVVELTGQLMPGLRPRPGAAAGEATEDALRADHAGHEGHGGRGAAGRHPRHLRRQGGRTTESYDRVLVAVGRVPNGRLLGRRGGGRHRRRARLHPVDSQMRTNVPHIFAIGDIVASPCWRTRPRTRARSPPKWPRATRVTSMRARFPPWPIPIRKWPGWASPRGQAKARASRSTRGRSPGPPAAARCRWGVMKASPN